MNANQKGTALVGGAITDEVMESSSSVLAPGMYGAGQKGLQQFYSPPEAAALAHKVIGDGVAVLDPTAGDGSLLREFNPTRSFGIEIDGDQIKASEGSYTALKGDFQHFYTLLKLGMSGWNAIVANPPFGLQWSDPTLRNGKETNSTVLTLMMVDRLLAENGQYVFICAKNRYERQITQLPEHAGIYAVVECADLFENTREECVILFGINPGIRSASNPGVLGTRSVSRDMLDLLGDWVLTLRDQAKDEYETVARSEYSAYMRGEEFTKLQAEYDRRVEKRIKTREFDAQLYNGDHIQWYPSAFAQLALRQAGLLGDFHGLNGQPVAYFAQNERLWFKLGDAEERGLVTLDPNLRQAVAHILGDIQKHRVPLYSVKPQQRLGFLDDIDTLVCKQDDSERRFKKGEVYRLDTSTKTIVEKEDRPVESKKDGKTTIKTFEKHRKVMSLTLSGQGAHYSVVDGGDNATQDISWLISHFEIPDPGEIVTKHPEDIAALEQLVRDVMDEFGENSKVWEETHSVSKPFTTRDFQVSDIARLLFKEFGICAWEQGLGKTVGALAFYVAATKLRAKKKLLITCPGDLIPQWIRECERFLGVTPTVIKTHGQAHQIAKHLRTGGEGIYIVHYEGMAINGTLRKNIQLPVITVKEWDERQLVKGTDKNGYWAWYSETNDHFLGRGITTEQLDTLGFTENHAEIAAGGRSDELCDYMAEKGYVQKWQRGYWIDGTSFGNTCHWGYIKPRWEQVTKKLTSKDICPQCHADTRNGWGGLFCDAELEDGSKCGYAHFSVRMKPIASLLSTSFHDGVAVLDEITYIQGRDSKRSKAMRGVQARYRLGLSGTPIKNYVHQIFWPLAWCLGYSRPWFPYDYDGGMTRFENDFCVIEYGVSGKRKEARKVLPDVTNLSRFWRMLASHNIRRRQEETGEDLVDIYYHDVRVPLGVSQAEQTKEWLKGHEDGDEGGFPGFFKEKYPDAKVVKAGLHKIMAPLLGLNWKLDYAATIPKGDPDYEWTGIEVSNWTPANLRTLELTMALVQSGRKVLVGSHIVDEGKWLAERLVEKGVAALHIVDESGTTVGKEKRAKIVYDFQTDDDIQVFCAGMKAIRLGHNLDTANAVVLNGLDFDYETLDQFVKRVRRLTSTKDVDVYVILPTLEGQDTITSRKWQLLGLKGNAADLALDGRLVLKNEQEISEKEMINQLQERGLTITDEAVDEQDILESWEATPQLEDFEGAALIPPRPEIAEPTEEEVDEQIALDSLLTVPDELVVEQNAAEMPVEPEIDPIDAAEAELAALLPENVELEDLDDPEAFVRENITPFAGDTGGQDAAEAFQAFVTSATKSSDPSPMPEIAEEVSETEPEAAIELPAVEGAAPEPVTEPAQAENAPAPALDYMGQLKQAKELFDLGVLDQAEFDELKATLLAGLRAAA